MKLGLLSFLCVAHALAFRPSYNSRRSRIVTYTATLDEVSIVAPSKDSVAILEFDDAPFLPITIQRSSSNARTEALARSLLKYRLHLEAKARTRRVEKANTANDTAGLRQHNAKSENLKTPTGTAKTANDERNRLQERFLRALLGRRLLLENKARENWATVEFLKSELQIQPQNDAAGTSVNEVAATRHAETNTQIVTDDTIAKNRAEDIAQIAAKEAAEKKQAERKLVEEAAERKRIEEAVAAERKRIEEAAERKRIEEVARLAAEEAAERKRAEEAAERKRVEEAVERKRIEEAARLAAEEAAERKRVEEAARIAAEEAAEKKRIEEAEERKRIEEAARIAAEEAAERKRVEEAARIAAEEAAERKRIEEAEERKRAEEAARIAAEKAAERKRAEEIARILAEKKRATEAKQRALLEVRLELQSKTYEEKKARENAILEEKRISERYAAMTLQDRAYNILLDLGLIKTSYDDEDDDDFDNY